MAKVIFLAGTAEFWSYERSDTLVRMSVNMSGEKSETHMRRCFRAAAFLHVWELLLPFCWNFQVLVRLGVVIPMVLICWGVLALFQGGSLCISAAMGCYTGGGGVCGVREFKEHGGVCNSGRIKYSRGNSILLMRASCFVAFVDACLLMESIIAFGIAFLEVSVVFSFSGILNAKLGKMARLQQTQRKRVGSIPRLPDDVIAAIAAEVDLL
ncbi:hypothetical protein AgCh_000944 [Apium graveolens]